MLVSKSIFPAYIVQFKKSDFLLVLFGFYCCYRGIWISAQDAPDPLVQHTATGTFLPASPFATIHCSCTYGHRSRYVLCAASCFAHVAPQPNRYSASMAILYFFEDRHNFARTALQAKSQEVNSPPPLYSLKLISWACVLQATAAAQLENEPLKKEERKLHHDASCLYNVFSCRCCCCYCCYSLSLLIVRSLLSSDILVWPRHSV